MRRIEILGFIATALNAGAFLPLAIKTYRDPHPPSDAFTITSFSVYFSAASLWTIYGIVIRSPSIVVSSLLTASIILFILMILGTRH